MMLKPWNATRDYALTRYLRAHSILNRLEAWALESVADPERERGSYSTEFVVVLALIVVLAASVLAVIAAKVVGKANSISF